MRISLKVIIYFMTAIFITAGVRLLAVMGHKGGPVKIQHGDDNTPVEIYRDIGDTVQIECNYPDSHESNEKSLCKGENPISCDILISITDEGRSMTKGRFHIRVNRRKKYFYVTIKNLGPDDVGSYWCVSDSLSENKFPKIDHDVGDAETTESDHPAPTIPPAAKTDGHHSTLQKPTSNRASEHRSIDSLTAGIIAAAVLCPLSLLILFLVLCRDKLPRTQVCCAAWGSSEQRTNAEHNAEGNHGDHQYEEIQMQNQQGSSGQPLPSVYATVNLAVDQLHYAGINFQDSTDGNALPDANKSVSSACSYSSISRRQGDTHPPAAEQTLYSTVKK